MLTWGDNSSDETGFVVESSTNEGRDWTTYATLASGATQVIVRPLACGAVYLFRVRAQRSADEAFSLCSDTVSFTTVDCSKLLLPFIQR